MYLGKRPGVLSRVLGTSPFHRWYMIIGHPVSTKRSLIEREPIVAPTLPEADWRGLEMMWYGDVRWCNRL